MNELSFRDKQLLKQRFPSDADYAEALERLDGGEPLAYLLGEWYFYDEAYVVSPACLIPRPETEHLVDHLVRHLPPNAVFADLCTGSGCIAISTLVHRPDCRAVAVDLSPEALLLAEENAKRNGVSDRITFLLSDVMTGNALDDRRFHALVSNPPYIQTAVIDTLSPEVQREPRMALDGGEDGLDFYRTLISDYKKNLLPHAFMLFEIGYDQGDALKRLCDCEVFRDYSGNDRMVLYIPTVD